MTSQFAGDSANEVSMIQVADVGIGLSGQNGNAVGDVIGLRDRSVSLPQEAAARPRPLELPAAR